MSTKQENTRELLLVTAMKLFARSGFDGTSVKELATEAGVNVSLVSYYFGGKEGLYRACVEQLGTKKLELMKRILTHSKTHDEFVVKLRMFTHEIIASYLEQPEWTRIIHRDIELDNPITEDVFRSTFLVMFETLVDFFSVAQKNGIIRRDVEPMIAANFFFGSVTHLTRMDHIGRKFMHVSLGDKVFCDKMIDEVMGLFTRGALTRSGERE
jgi:AcrR family transcriptional regulator